MAGHAAQGIEVDSAILREKLLKGSLAGLLRVSLAVPLYLFLTPYVLSRLGTAMFGIWSFSNIMISFVNLTDFGFKNSLVRHVAGNLDQEAEIDRYFNAAFWMYAVMTLITLVLTMLFAHSLVSGLLRVPAGYHAEAVFVIIISAASFGLRFLATPFQAIIEGFQDLFYSQMISLVWLISNFTGSIVALAVKPDIYALGLASLFPSLIVLVLFICQVRRRFPFVRVRLNSSTEQQSPICSDMASASRVPCL